MMRYGVVGVGYFGADLARFMNEFDDAQITMVYDPENGETIADTKNRNFGIAYCLCLITIVELD